MGHVGWLSRTAATRRESGDDPPRRQPTDWTSDWGDAVGRAATSDIDRRVNAPGTAANGVSTGGLRDSLTHQLAVEVFRRHRDAGSGTCCRCGARAPCPTRWRAAAVITAAGDDPGRHDRLPPIEVAQFSSTRADGPVGAQGSMPAHETPAWVTGWPVGGAQSPRRRAIRGVPTVTGVGAWSANRTADSPAAGENNSVPSGDGPGGPARRPVPPGHLVTMHSDAALDQLVHCGRGRRVHSWPARKEGSRAVPVVDGPTASVTAGSRTRAARLRRPGTPGRVPDWAARFAVRRDWPDGAHDLVGLKHAEAAAQRFLHRDVRSWRRGPLHPVAWSVVTVSRRDFLLHTRRRECRSPDCPTAAPVCSLPARRGSVGE
jgi:hypothetical protein